MNRNALLALKKRVFIISLVSSHHWPFLLFDENEDQTRSRSFPSSEEVFDRVVLSVPLHLSGRSYSVPCAPSHHSGCVGSLDRHLQCQPRRTVTSPTEMSLENSFECFNQSKFSESSYSAKIEDRRLSKIYIGIGGKSGRTTNNNANSGIGVVVVLLEGTIH